MLLMLRLFLRCDETTCCNAEADLNDRPDDDLQGVCGQYTKEITIAIESEN